MKQVIFLNYPDVFQAVLSASGTWRLVESSSAEWCCLAFCCEDPQRLNFLFCASLIWLVWGFEGLQRPVACLAWGIQVCIQTRHMSVGLMLVGKSQTERICLVSLWWIRSIYSRTCWTQPVGCCPCLSLVNGAEKSFCLFFSFYCLSCFADWTPHVLQLWSEWFPCCFCRRGGFSGVRIVSRLSRLNSEAICLWAGRKDAWTLD